MKFTATELRNIADALDAMTKLRKEKKVEFGVHANPYLGDDDNYFEVSWKSDPDSSYYDQYVVEPVR